MHASASAFAAEPPRQSAVPPRFSPAALRALGALALAMPGISVDFDVDGGGGVHATVSRRRGQLVALVVAETGGGTSVVDCTGATVATLGDDEAGIRWALRCEVEGGGTPWEM